MAEGKRPFGRGNLVELVSGGSGSKSRGRSSGRSYYGATSGSQDEPGRKPIGRGDFIARMQAQFAKEKLEEAKSLATTSSQERSVVEPPKVETVTEKLSEMQVRVEEDTGSDESVVEKQGQYGEKKVFSTNYIRLRTDADKQVFEFEIRFQPDIASTNFRYQIVYRHFRDKRDMVCYDGGKKLLTPVRITNSSAEYLVKHPVDDSEIIMAVIFKKKARARDCAFLYNTLFRNFSRILHMTRYKDKYYDPRAALKIPQHKLEIWPGVVTAVEEFDGGIQLRCDINHRVLRTETAYDIITSIVRRSPQNFKVLVEKELLGECVSTKYNNNLYRVDDIVWNENPLSSFEISNGGTITFVEYYKKQYNLEIKDLKQPLLISRRKNREGQKSRLICLIPELCNMTGLTDKMTSDVKVMKDIAVYTRVTPAQRAYAFRKFLNNIKGNEEAQKMLRKWGLNIDDEPVNVDGRNLLSERLIFGNNASVTAVNGDWQKSFKSVSVYHSIDLLNWYLIFPEKDARAAASFSTLIRRVGPGLGIEISEPNRVGLRDDRNESYIHALRKHINHSVQMVVCICPTARDDRYSAIKKFCCIEVPVPSQVVNTITLSREDRLRSVVQSVALQMNVKLGGASWGIHVPFKNTMVCGVDTYHDKLNGNSVGGFVASCGLKFTEWYSKTIFQGGKEELIDDLIDSFHAALKHYKEKFADYPERIVVYRDGLSDGEMEACYNVEVCQFIQAFKEINHGINPKFTFVIVRKRISTKIFQMADNNGGELVNPNPGDLVDQTITKKSFYDFFLVSQFVRAGTATPCHYVVLYDNSNMQPDHIQRLTYKFCHLYYNWLGTIRVPAPCYYAHKLAYLVGQSVKTTPHESLDDKLYYI